jgi:hypothetical protein
MAKSKWVDIEVGDFFVPECQDDNNRPFLYQKVDSKKANGYNAVLLNTGELCNLYIGSNHETAFQKVEVTFEIQTVTE